MASTSILAQAYDSATIMAQGNIDQGGLQGLLEEFGDAIKLWGGFAIGAVAAVFATIALIKAISAFTGKQMSEGVKHVIRLVIIVALAVMGIGGLFAIVESASPAAENSGVTDYLN